MQKLEVIIKNIEKLLIGLAWIIGYFIAVIFIYGGISLIIALICLFLAWMLGCWT